MRGRRTTKRKRAKEPSWLSLLSPSEKALLGAVCLLFVGLMGVFVYKALFVQPDIPGEGGGRKWPLSSSSSESSEEGGEDEEIYIDYGDGIRPKTSGERKSESFYTVLILGRDTGGGGNTDTMLLASYDVTNQKATVMSIPRDTMVNVNWDVKKINSIYPRYGGGERGVKALYREISQLVGFEPDYQVVVEWDAVGKIVDAIGGVYFDNPYPMDYHDPSQDLVIEQEAGYRLLSGSDAMQVIRWRKNDSDSPYGYSTGGIGDAGRMQLQQDFLKAVLRQMMTPKNVLKIGKIAKVFQESVETDLTFQNVLWFGKQAVSGGLKVEDVTFLTMPWKGVAAYSRALSQQMKRDFYLDYVVPLPNRLLKVINDQLSPYKQPFSLSDLDIMSVNEDGSISSTTGHVEDEIAARPPVKFGDTPQEPAYTMDEFGNYFDPKTGELVYYTDADGNLVDANTGEIVDPGALGGELPTEPPGEEAGGDPAGTPGEDPNETPVTPTRPPQQPMPQDPDEEEPTETPYLPPLTGEDVDPVTGEPYPVELPPVPFEPMQPDDPDEGWL